MKINICGHRYLVRDVENLISGVNPVWGKTDYNDRVIDLDSSMNKDLRNEVLLHEVVHGIIFHTNDRGEHSEALVNAISNGLHQAGVRI